MSGDFAYLASRLDKLVMPLKKEMVRTSTGDFDKIWVDAFPKRLWAEVITIGGEEGRMAAAQSGMTRYRITMYYRTDIDASMKMRLEDGRVVQITAPPRDPDGDRVMIEVNAEYKEGAV